MATITKKQLVDTLANATGVDRAIVRQIVLTCFEQIIEELGKGNRLEFRDFGVFEVKYRASRNGQNPRTLQPVRIPARQTVRFKEGRMLREALASGLPGKAVKTEPAANGQVIHVKKRRSKAPARA